MKTPNKKPPPIPQSNLGSNYFKRYQNSYETCSIQEHVSQENTTSKKTRNMNN